MLSSLVAPWQHLCHNIYYYNEIRECVSSISGSRRDMGTCVVAYRLSTLRYRSFVGSRSTAENCIKFSFFYSHRLDLQIRDFKMQSLQNMNKITEISLSYSTWPLMENRRCDPYFLANTYNGMPTGHRKLYNSFL